MIRHETIADIDARECLLDVAFGTERGRKTSERLREGRMPADGLSLVAMDRGHLVGTVRLWHVSIGADRPALLLGPLAVDPARQGCGIGTQLMRHGIKAARRLGHQAMLLVGDEPYYSRFGFSAARTGALFLPGPYDPRRLLALDLVPGALSGAAGMIGATGVKLPASVLPVTAFAPDNEASFMPRAA